MISQKRSYILVISIISLLSSSALSSAVLRNSFSSSTSDVEQQAVLLSNNEVEIDDTLVKLNDDQNEEKGGRIQQTRNKRRTYSATGIAGKGKGKGNHFTISPSPTVSPYPSVSPYPTFDGINDYQFCNELTIEVYRPSEDIMDTATGVSRAADNNNITVLFLVYNVTDLYERLDIVTQAPSMMPSLSPSPSQLPSQSPSHIPSSPPSLSQMPSQSPSAVPSSAPTLMPSSVPSSVPSSAPTSMPSSVPTAVPSSAPTPMPSRQPSVGPSSTPTSMPSIVLSSNPTVCQDSANSFGVIEPKNFTTVSMNCNDIRCSCEDTEMPFYCAQCAVKQNCPETCGMCGGSPANRNLAKKEREETKRGRGGKKKRNKKKKKPDHTTAPVAFMVNATLAAGGNIKNTFCIPAGFDIFSYALDFTTLPDSEKNSTSTTTSRSLQQEFEPCYTVTFNDVTLEIGGNEQNCNDANSQKKRFKKKYKDVLGDKICIPKNKQCGQKSASGLPSVNNGQCSYPDREVCCRIPKMQNGKFVEGHGMCVTDQNECANTRKTGGKNGIVYKCVNSTEVEAKQTATE